VPTVFDVQVPLLLNCRRQEVLFVAMILPYFLYCAETWRSCGQALRGSVEVLYRHCLRIVLNDIAFRPKLSNATVYTVCGMLPLSLEYQLRSASLLYGIVRLKSNTTFNELFHLQSGTRVTRDTVVDAYRLETPFTLLERDRCAFRWWGCILWNSIPFSIRRVSDIYEFRRRYKEYLIAQLTAGITMNAKFYEYV
jgi:hypothetical protein